MHHIFFNTTFLLRMMKGQTYNIDVLKRHLILLLYLKGIFFHNTLSNKNCLIDVRKV